MKSAVSLLSLVAAAAVCYGQVTTYSISGAVKDTGGAAVAGATVELERGKVSATTDASGLFTLGQASRTLHRPADRVPGNLRSVVLCREGCIMTLSEKSAVTVGVYNGQGQVLASESRAVDAGTHAVALPRRSSGLDFYRVTIDNERYVFASVGVGRSSRAASFRLDADAAGGLAKRTRAEAKITDVLVVKKAGCLDYRLAMTNPDTSGLDLVMLPSEGDVTDADGNVYQTVRIGAQVWMTSNLKVTKLSDGTPIAYVNNAGWSGTSDPAYCHYQNNAVLGARYGALYNWFAVGTGKLAPKGWHVPTAAEWETLVTYLKANGYNSRDTSGNYTGKALAAREDWKWGDPGTAEQPLQTGYDIRTNNKSGFGGLPAGMRHQGDNADGYIGYNAFFWKREGGSRTLCSFFLGLFDNSYPNWNGFSVRCVRDN